MSFADWMILAAAMLPYVTVAAAKGGRSGYDNASPRSWANRLDGWRQRAESAHRNHFEAFAPFAAGVLVAEMAHARQGVVDALAGAFIVVRVVYTLAYVSDRASVRSLVWFAGLACIIALFCAGV